MIFERPDLWMLALGLLCVVYAAGGAILDEIQSRRDRRARKKIGFYRRTGRWPF